MPAKTRIYLVKPKDGRPARLIESYHADAALRKAAMDDFEVSVPTSLEVVGLLAKGANVELVPNEQLKLTPEPPTLTEQAPKA